MDLGWLDVCLKVESAARSRAFYEKLGFQRVEGQDDQGWAVVVLGEYRLGLYETQHMCSEPFSLNFRGGDVLENSAKFMDLGLEFDTVPKPSKAGGASASLRDPDGHLIFFDTAPGETKKSL